MSKEILIFASKADAPGGARLLGGRQPAEAVVSIETIRVNLASFVGSLDQIIPEVKAKEDGFKLSSFDVAVGVNAKGEVGFLGTGVEVGATATLTLKFSRS
jgi:hypothetical protein